MSIMIGSILLSLIFFFLGAVHFNWATGGTLGYKQSLPTKESGELVMTPKKFDSALIGVGLSAFGLFYIMESELISHQLPAWIFTYGGWVIPAVFLLRAIGDFKYVGFFKRVKSTKFSKFDKKFFTPLCLGIAIWGILIQLANY
ncbi:MAG: hypothetical protein ACI89M_002304 [Chitinophagales bacterium]|jgi:hypothetical protein